jgi:hypothetical protein
LRAAEPGSASASEREPCWRRQRPPLRNVPAEAVRRRPRLADQGLVAVRCEGCGYSRLLTARSRRRIEVGGPTLCELCRLRRTVVVTVEHRRWWLSRFDDATIAELADGLFGRGDPRAVRSWRLRLLG